MTAIDPASADVVGGILRRESNSLLSYIGDAYPWTTAAGGPALKTLNRLIKQEKQAVTDLGRFLVRRKVTPPFLGSYPAWFTSWNFIAMGKLVPKLLEAQHQLMSETQAALSKVTDAAARREVERLLAVKRMTLAALESMMSPPAASA